MADELVLGLETSSLRGSVALARNGQLVGVRQLTAERRHTSELFPAIADLLRDASAHLADVTLFAFSRGPGSFTGLRVAATIGRMLHGAVGCPVVAVPTLEVIAENASADAAVPPRLAVVLDAKRGQVYGGLFARDGGVWAAVDTPAVHEPGSWLAQIEKPVAVIGDGMGGHAAAIVAVGATILDEGLWRPRADVVVALGCRLAVARQTCRPEEIIPLYLRPPECEEVYEVRRATARRRRGE